MRFHLMNIPICPAPGCDGDVFELLIEQAELADAEGWDGFWVAEHHFSAYGGSVPNTAVLLAALATRTRRLRLGSAVAVLPLRDGTTTAEDFAMVDVLSGGRLELGVGRGFLRAEYERMGVPFDERSERFESELRALERGWGSSGIDSGLTPRPVQPRLPLWVAVSTSLESCRLAGECGYGLMLNPYNRRPEETDAAIAVYRDAAQSHGQEPRVLVNQLACVVPEGDGLQEAATALDSYLAAVHGEFVAHPGMADLPSLRFEDLYPDRLLFGEVSDIAERAFALAARGVTDVAFMTHFGDPAHPNADRTRAALAQQLLPSVHVTSLLA